MKEISYFLAKVCYRLKNRDKEVMSEYFRKQGITVGKGCNVCSNIVTTESYLISLGDNVTVAGDVKFIIHDNSVSKMIPSCTDLFGKITLGNNCFIGANSVIMYGVQLANDITVAAGSVVVNSFDEERIVIGGNPAKKICTYEEFIAKRKNQVFDLSSKEAGHLKKTILESGKLVERGFGKKR